MRPPLLLAVVLTVATRPSAPTPAGADLGEAGSGGGARMFHSDLWGGDERLEALAPARVGAKDGP